MKQITCINCDLECRVTINVIEGKYVFSGNKCNEGVKHLIDGLTAPTRSLMIMMKTAFPDTPFLSVRTNGEVPKNKVKKIVRVLSKVIITERKRIGDTIIPNISRTGCDVIAASDMLRETG
ncbi:MAG: DUF1667 domain-containing protein [Treponema sp.]|nr:DUF1667 domain-containing protein [Treponema sp.]